MSLSDLLHCPLPGPVWHCFPVLRLGFQNQLEVSKRQLVSPKSLIKTLSHHCVDGIIGNK